MHIEQILIGPPDVSQRSYLSEISIKLDDSDNILGYLFRWKNGEVKKILSPDVDAKYTDPDDYSWGKVMSVTARLIKGIRIYETGNSLSELMSGVGTVFPKTSTLELILPGYKQYVSLDAMHPSNRPSSPKTTIESAGYDSAMFIVGNLAYKLIDGKRFPHLEITSMLEHGDRTNAVLASSSYEPYGLWDQWSTVTASGSDLTCGKYRTQHDYRKCNEAPGDWVGSSCLGPATKNEMSVYNGDCPRPGYWDFDYTELLQAHSGCVAGTMTWGAPCIKPDVGSVCTGDQPIQIVNVAGKGCNLQCTNAECVVSTINIGTGAAISQIGWRKDVFGNIKGFAFEFADGKVQKLLSPFVDANETDPYLIPPTSNDVVEWLNFDHYGLTSLRQYISGDSLELFYKYPEQSSTMVTPTINKWVVDGHLLSTGPIRNDREINSIAAGVVTEQKWEVQTGTIYLAGYLSYVKNYNDGNFYPMVQFVHRSNALPRDDKWQPYNFPVLEKVLTPEIVSAEAAAATIANAPINGGWSDWALVSKYEGCDTGNDIYKRSCDNPVPLNGGLFCPGDEIKEVANTNLPCKENVKFTVASTNTFPAKTKLKEGYALQPGDVDNLTSIPKTAAGSWSKWALTKQHVKCGKGTNYWSRSCTGICDGESTAKNVVNNGECEKTPITLWILLFVLIVMIAIVIKQVIGIQRAKKAHLKLVENKTTSNL
jgi:hypothetical protein